MSDIKQSDREPNVPTRTVINWMYLKGLDDPALSEAMQIIRAGTPLEDAAKELGIGSRIGYWSIPACRPPSPIWLSTS
jgi:hypothetical protein